MSTVVRGEGLTGKCRRARRVLHRGTGLIYIRNPTLQRPDTRAQNTRLVGNGLIHTPTVILAKNLDAHLGSATDLTSRIRFT